MGTLAAVARTGWWWRRGPRTRRCSECGYKWPLPHKEHARSHLVNGAVLRAARYPDIRVIHDQVEGATGDDIEVREALAHCPQCGSGHFTEYRAEGPPPESG